MVAGVKIPGIGWVFKVILENKASVVLGYYISNMLSNIVRNRLCVFRIYVFFLGPYKQSKSRVPSSYIPQIQSVSVAELIYFSKCLSVCLNV